MAKTLREFLAELDAEGIKDARRYDRVRRFLSMKAREKRIPVSGSFELTPLCNLDCKMCYVHLEKDQLQGAALLPVETWIRIAQQAIDAGMLYAQITGGECLTYPGFKEFYTFLRDKGIEITLKTNGLLLKDEMLDFIIKHPPALIGISVYGANDEGYDAVTGHRVFNQVMDNIDQLQKANIPVLISITPSSYMKDTTDILKLLHDRNIPWEINPSLIQPREETGRALADTTLSDYLAIMDRSNQLQGIPYYRKYEDSELPEFGNSQEYAGPIRCAAGKGCFSVDWKGRMSPCINFNDLETDIVQNDFQTVWAQIGAKIEAIPTPVECNGCAYEGVCPICVVAHAADAPLGHANRSICEWNKAMIKAGLRSFK